MNHLDFTLHCIAGFAKDQKVWCDFDGSTAGGSGDLQWYFKATGA